MIGHWWRFNAVGMAGVVVQLTALWALSQLRALPYLAAVALAIEISLLHNFAWHEVWTWRGLAIEQRWLRLLRFQLGNGLVSLAGNTFFTWLFHQFAGWPLLLSNAAAICCTSILNFVVAAGWVFRPSAADGS